MKLFEDFLETEVCLQKPIILSDFKYVNGNTMKVNTNNVLDQYFTKSSTATDLFKKTCDIISQYEKNLKDFQWIEPSAGNGVFYNLLPKNNRAPLFINKML